MPRLGALLAKDDLNYAEHHPGRCARACGFTFRALCCCSRRRNGGKAAFSPFRLFVSRLVKSTMFSNFILGVIFLNSVLITLQMVDSTNLVAAFYFDVIDKVLMGIYILELSLKLYAYQERFLESGWNIFDAFIVSISIFETAVYTFLNNESSISPAIFRLFRVFKALRAMRAIRAISFLKNLQVIIVTLLKSIPAMGSIILLLLLILYIFAIIFVTLYKDIMPLKFGNLWLAMFSLFQLITLDDWSEYYYVVRAVDPSMAETIMVYMTIFIVLETFICMNLFIAVIVNNLERANMRERQKRKRRQELLAKMYEDQHEQANNKRIQSKKRRRTKRKAKKLDAKGGGSSTNAEAEPRSTLEAHGSGLGDPGSDGEDEGNLPERTKPRPSDGFFQDERLPLWQRELQPTILALLASLDHNVNVLHNHQRTLDELVDVTVAQNQQSQAHAASTLSGPPGTH